MNDSTTIDDTTNVEGNIATLVGDDKIILNETEWPDSLPGENESNLLFIVASDANLRWVFYNIISQEF